VQTEQKLRRAERTKTKIIHGRTNENEIYAMQVNWTVFAKRRLPRKCITTKHLWQKLCVLTSWYLAHS